MTDKEIKEAKSLRWLALQFPKVENPKDNGDRMCNCINLYCTNAAELIERQAAENEMLKLYNASLTESCDGYIESIGIYKAEVERLKAPTTDWLVKGISAEQLEKERIQAHKIEAYKEFAERVKQKAMAKYKTIDNEYLYEFDNNFIDNLLKELVGEDDA